MITALFSLISLPSIVSSGLTFLAPFATAVLSFSGYILKEFWTGLKVMLANASTFVTVAVFCGISAIASAHYFKVETDCPKVETTKTVKDWNPFNNGH